MLRITLASLALAVTAVPAFAADAPAAASNSTADSTIGDLIDNPATKAILDKYFPGMSTNPQIDMARGMTLKQIQQFQPDSITDEKLALVDADLAKLPPK